MPRKLRVEYPWFRAVMAFTLGPALPDIAANPLTASEPGKGGRVVNYGRPFEPPTRPAFIPLPPGEIEPQGWLRDWCRTARDGYTGHMDEMHPDFRKAWAADYRMTGDQPSYWDKGAPAATGGRVTPHSQSPPMA